MLEVSHVTDGTCQLIQCSNYSATTSLLLDLGPLDYVRAIMYYVVSVIIKLCVQTLWARAIIEQGVS